MHIENLIAVLPVAATEQHGPHLPVSVDTTIIEGIVEHAVERLPEDLDVTFLPSIGIGKSNEHSAYKGTISFSVETLMRMWMEIGDSVSAAGVKKMVLFNSHGGQMQPMEIVARDLRVKHNMLVVSANWWQLGLPDDLISEQELKHGIHAGDMETSMMLHLAPDKVDMDHATDFSSQSLDISENYPMIGLKFGWQIQDLNEAGACGNASLATAEKGRILVEYAAERLLDLLRQIQDFPISTLKQGPQSTAL